MESEKKLSRRDFLVGMGVAGIAASTAGLAGCTPGSSAQATSNDKSADANKGLPETWDMECDVLVLGGGSAGSSTAYSAAAAGADVLVLDSQSNLKFTSTSICVGNFIAMQSDEQKAAGIEDSPDLVYEDFIKWGAMDYGSGQANREDVVRVFADNNHAAYEILKGWGLTFEEPQSTDGGSVPRVSIVPAGMLQTLLQEKSEEVGVRYEFNTTFTDLITNSDGVVVGAYAENERGNTIAVKARKATVVATGGLSFAEKHLNECLPGFGDVPSNACAAHTGLGHDAIMNLGGALWGRTAVCCCEGFKPNSTDMAHFVAEWGYGAIVVDRNGNRYMNEGKPWSGERSRALVGLGKHPEYDCFFNWQVWDQTLEDSVKDTGYLIKNEDNEEFCLVADTIEELAEMMGAPNLPATLAKYNEDMENGGIDTAFGREIQGWARNDKPFAMNQPPFYAWGGSPVIQYSTCTSFYVDAEMRPLNVNEEPIGGDRLRTVGELMMRSLDGNMFMTGSSIGGNCTFGFYLGSKLAELEPWE